MAGRSSDLPSGQLTGSDSTEDLSEYTDADESISAPTEFLAEFLSAVMLKDYETALKYCKLILQYEPNNATAKEFYPLIIEKIQICDVEQETDSDSVCSDSESSSSHSSSSGSGGDADLTKPTDSDGTTASYSSLEDEEPDHENNAMKNSRKFSSTDFTNGNTTELTTNSKQRLVEAIQRKLEDNRRTSRLPLKHRLQSLTRNVARTTLVDQTEQTKESSEWCQDGKGMAVGVAAAETPEEGEFEKTGWVGALDLRGCSRRYSGWDEKSPESEGSEDFSAFKTDMWGEKSPESEGSLNFPFSSDSSVTDPYSILTVQQMRSKNNV